MLGEDHPSTLASANNLAIDLTNLGEYQAARDLDEDTLARRRRVLGEDHPDTLSSANNLAIDLANLGEYQAARELDEDTLARRRRVLGEDHPDTLPSANNLAARPERAGRGGWPLSAVVPGWSSRLGFTGRMAHRLLGAGTGRETAAWLRASACVPDELGRPGEFARCGPACAARAFQG